jgi:hypothetical protein
MCIYCMIADWGKQFLPFPNPNPYWPIPADPNTVPVTVPVTVPITTTTYPLWTMKQLEEFEHILELVKEMEDKLGGCPCEDPSKMDYLKQLRKVLEVKKDEDAASIIA